MSASWTRLLTRSPNGSRINGAGGAWVGVSTANDPANYLHYSRGRWTTESGPGRPGVGALIYDLARVPGTRTLWSAGMASPLSGPPFVERRR
ncbi:hypothetical protein ACFHW2_14050 [Actinomadura sp. LOL_016]|uniref:hypothetical protein n=1 Tax=unclassified Actinomadura TaxID=2626254 RepID=UPI003A80D5B5